MLSAVLIGSFTPENHEWNFARYWSNSINCKENSGGSRNHNKLALHWFSHRSPSVSYSRATALKMVPGGLCSNDYSSPESPCSKSLQVLTQAKQTEREILLPAPNLSSCHRLHCGIIRSYNPVRYNHVLPNPVELLGVLQLGTLFDSDLIKSARVSLQH